MDVPILLGVEAKRLVVLRGGHRLMLTHVCWVQQSLVLMLHRHLVVLGLHLRRSNRLMLAHVGMHLLRVHLVRVHLVRV